MTRLQYGGNQCPGVHAAGDVSRDVLLVAAAVAEGARQRAANQQGVLAPRRILRLRTPALFLPDFRIPAQHGSLERVISCARMAISSCVSSRSNLSRRDRQKVRSRCSTMTSTTAMLSSSVSPLLSQRPCPEVLPSIRLWLGARALPMKGEHQAASFVDSLASLAIGSESGR